MGTTQRSTMGTTRDGHEVGGWRLTNGELSIQIAELGGRWLGWHGAGRELLIGPQTVAAIERDSCYIGALVGRYANRLRGGSFEIAGRRYQVPPNQGTLALHGGPAGLTSLIWRGEAAEVAGCPALRLSCVSPAGDMGFPGELRVTVTYLLTAAGVQLDYQAVSDAPTVLNLTNHAYFNLAQATGQDVRGHRLQVAADRVVAVDDQALPDGTFWPVAGTDFDLRAGRLVGPVCDSADERIAIARGIDHCYVLDETAQVAARLSAGGLAVEVLTDQPGVQVYCGQWLTGDYTPFAGMCLETQHFPDSPNRPEFPSTLLAAGVEWATSTTYRLG